MHKPGFTLIELLIVIAIIIIISSIALYNFSQGITKSKVARTMTELRSIPSILATGKSIPESDPWGNPYERNPQTRYYYSYGPDEKDDSGLTLYDPTNGVKSQGDIYFP
jgi:prepilin-type N-terminal cleavage/methylation domain-containing protein